MWDWPIWDALNLPWVSKYPKTLEAYAERFGVDIYETANELIDRGKADALSFVPKIIYVMLYWRLNAESTHYYLSLLLSQ